MTWSMWILSSITVSNTSWKMIPSLFVSHSRLTESLLDRYIICVCMWVGGGWVGGDGRGV